ncbi:uncharacterized protein LOC132953005 [Metopolophium dirhodum]|uniref:uncharacterized protein LOC132943955 n=1 Tax=Metopolophium dirhodum TaxID=44670 RepID=UPI0029902BD2|nr:uncharacterized protein LOC132943955 [Metopolophium dirhodum]XP_060881525.1 uncharacterized protein LOC132953005 [Metopolophium dirhodum]
MPDFDSTFMANWPMKNEQMFLNVSKCLLEDSFVSLVENWFMSIGGNSVKDNLKRVLSNIFSNEFAIHCSWTGRGKNVTTKLCDSKIVIVLKRCIKNQKEYSDALFESCLADWFRYATTRHKRSLD